MSEWILMTRLTLLLSFSMNVVLLINNTAQCQSKPESRSAILVNSLQGGKDSITEADRLWDMAIKAKGGRGNLNKVNSISFGKNGKSTLLLVFPDKMFSWEDMRPGQFGLKIEVYNYETGYGYWHSGLDDSVKIFKDIRNDPLTRSRGNMNYLMISSQLQNFLETKWLKPKPLTALKSRIAGNRVDRVDVLIEGYGEPVRYAVFLDEKTHLPVRFARCYTIYSGDISRNQWVTDVRFYREIQGIKVPMESDTIGTGKWTRRYFEINPDYNPGVFDRQPDLTADGFQWRKNQSQAGPDAALPEPLTSMQIAELIVGLGSDDMEVKQAATRNLVSAGKQVVPQLSMALQKAADTSLRYYLAAALIRLDKENIDATKTLADIITDRNLKDELRQDSAFGLLSNETGIQMLISLLNDNDISVKRYVIFALDELTERSEIPEQVKMAIPTLNKLKKDKDEIVRRMAREVLDQIKQHKK